MDHRMHIHTMLASVRLQLPHLTSTMKIESCFLIRGSARSPSLPCRNLCARPTSIGATRSDWPKSTKAACTPPELTKRRRSNAPLLILAARGLQRCMLAVAIAARNDAIEELRPARVAGTSLSPDPKEQVDTDPLRLFRRPQVKMHERISGCSPESH